MSSLKIAIPQLRKSVVAILKLHEVRAAKVKKGREVPAKVGAAIVGTAFCVSPDRLLTAFHVFNAGQPREPKDKFYAFTVPQNGDKAFHFPITGFPLELPELDLAVLECGSCATPGQTVTPIPLCFDPVEDGAHVVTLGFPAPEIAAVNLDKNLNYVGGNFFLKSHANEGIVSASYNLGTTKVYELNVGWHHGESGGPIALLQDVPCVFSVMQQYRKVQAPHGIFAGPHRGVALSAAKSQLASIGVGP